MAERWCIYVRSGELSASELFRHPTAARAVPCHWKSDRSFPLETPMLHQQTGRSFPAHLHSAGANDHLHHAETSADECGPRKCQCIDNSQPSSGGRASLKERSSQTSLESGSLHHLWAPSALDEAAVVQNPLHRSLTSLLPSTTADASGTGSESTSFEALFRSIAMEADQ